MLARNSRHDARNTVRNEFHITVQNVAVKRESS